MRKILLLAFGCLIALPALTQTPLDRVFKIAEIFGKGDTTTFVNLATKVIVPTDGMTIRYNVPQDSARLFLPNNGEKYEATVTFRKIGGSGPPPSYDTLWKLGEQIEPENTRMTHVNMTSYTNSGKQFISNKSFSAVTVATSPASSTVTVNNVAMLEFWGERYAGHGTVNIYIDGIFVATYNQGFGEFNTDLQRNAPTFRKKVPLGTHTISVRSVTGQHIVDFINAYTYTVTPHR